MNVDTFEDDIDITFLLIIGFVRQTCIRNPLVTDFEILQLIQSFYQNNAVEIQQDANEEEESKTRATPTPPPQPMDIIHETTNILKSRNSIEPSILLIYGYIREECRQITSVLCDLIYCFYTKMNGTSFVWRIDNKSKLLTKLLVSSSSGTGTETVHFDSDVFEVSTAIREDDRKKSKTFICSYCNNAGCCSHCKRINHLSLKYYLAIFANGIDSDTRGEFELQLNLVSIPSILQSITFMYSIHCHELNNSWFSSAHHNNVEGKTTRCESVALSTNDIAVLYESQAIDSLTFYIALDVIYVKLQNENKNNKLRYNPRYYFDDKRYIDDYKDALFSKFMMINDEWKFDWNVCEEIIGSFKEGNIASRLIVSDIFYNRWCLTLTHKKYEEEDIGTIGLRLCSLPSNISSIVVQIKLHCVQSSCSWSTVKKFHLQNKVYRGQDIMIRDKSGANNLCKLTICAHIMVIEAFDLKGNEMSLRTQQQQQMHDNRTVTSIGYKFEAEISGDFNQRYYYQHISMSKDGRFENISNEELQKQDCEKHPHHHQRRLHHKNNNNQLNDNNNNNNNHNDGCFVSDYDSKSGESASDLQRIGTLGWNFKPLRENRSHKHLSHNKVHAAKAKKRIHKLYYQHICIEKPFVNKQNEELRFEDMFKKCASKESSYNMLEGEKRNEDKPKQVKQQLHVHKINEKLQKLVCKMSDIFEKWDDKNNNSDINHNNNNVDYNNDNDNEFKIWYDAQIKYKEYYDTFVDNGWDDLDVLDALKNEHLIKMKIYKQGHRVKILRKIKQLKKKAIDINRRKDKTEMQYDSVIFKIMAAIIIFSLFCNTFLLFKH